MATVYIDRQYSSIFSRLADDKVVNTGEKIFNNYMELAIFAAIIAVGKGGTLLKNNGPEIPDRVFYHNGKEGVVYLIALLDSKDPYILKDDKRCWKIFQEYVNSGMSEISGWLIENPMDVTGVDTLLNSIAERASQLLDEGCMTGELPEIDF